LDLPDKRELVGREARLKQNGFINLFGYCELSRLVENAQEGVEPGDEYGQGRL
jgi:hypothetical protein